MSCRRFFVLGARLVVFSGVLAVLTSSAWAQGSDYAKGNAPWYNFVANFEPRKVPPPNFSNSPRVDQLIKNGKLMLSLDDFIALGLENNLDLAIARYNLDIADTDILRSKAGTGIRGVATGIVQGTPGGGVGGFGTGASGAGPGGTSGAAGGAGTGSGGQVLTTTGVGPAIPNYDPVLTSGLSIEHAKTPESNTFLTGVPFLQQNTGTGNFGYQQGFASGTIFNVGFNNNRQTTNAFTRTDLLPLLTSSMRFTLTQHLLQGLSVTSNRRFIVMAKNNREISDVSFRGQVIATVTQLQNIYWDLVNAYEDLRVKERSLALANQLLSDTEKQVQIGTLAPIETVRQQSAVASAKQQLIVSQTALQLQQLLTKDALARNLQDAALAAAEVVPTDTMTMPAVEPVTPLQDLMNDALSHRWELAQSRIDLTNRKINKDAAKNALLPTLDLVGWYGTTSLAGIPNVKNPQLPAGLTPSGYFDALHSVFAGDFPDYAVGLQLNIPIRNRAAQADQVRSELEYNQAEMRLQQLQNQIRIQVINAQYSVVQNRAQVEAAAAASRLAEESLTAEQKKYLLGASTNYNVMQAQNNLTQADSNLVAARTAYEKSRVLLDGVTGLTLTHLNIQIEDAVTGKVTTEPHVPGVAPRTEPQTPPAPGQAVPQPQAPPAPTTQAPPAAAPAPTAPAPTTPPPTPPQS